MLSPRERIKAVLNFRRPDVLPWCETFFDETVIKWFGEGLPADKVTVIEWMNRAGGVSLLNWPVAKGFDPHAYFGCYNRSGLPVPIDLGPIPRHKQRPIAGTERYVDILTQTGIVARRFKEARHVWYNMPMLLSFPVKDRETWEEYKKRLDPYNPRRYPIDWDKDAYIEVFENYQQGGAILYVSGFYGFGAQLMGVPAFVSAFYKDPELIEDMIKHWEFYTTETVRNAVETLKDRIDLVFWWEDMAEKHGPCISPRLYKEYLLPHYKRVTGFFNSNKIDRIMMDSDGNIRPLLDLVIKAGITGLWPLEVNAGMNALEVKKEYGNSLFMIGNLDKRELAKGGQEMQNEIDSKVPQLKNLGGYIPGVDHLVHVEFTFNKFLEYANYMKAKLPY